VHLKYKRIFGIGTTGVAVTALIWTTVIYVEKWLGIPKINIGITFRWILFGLFAFDFLATIVWSLIELPRSDGGKKLVTTGPFQWVRHPLYSAIIWSGTGMVVLGYRSWAVIFSVLPINLFWTWFIKWEEDDLIRKFGEAYREYQKNTGLFFPILRKPHGNR